MGVFRFMILVFDKLLDKIREIDDSIVVVDGDNSHVMEYYEITNFSMFYKLVFVCISKKNNNINIKTAENGKMKSHYILLDEYRIYFHETSALEYFVGSEESFEAVFNEIKERVMEYLLK